MNPNDVLQSIRNWLLTRIAGNNEQGLPNRVVLPDEAGGTGPIQSRQVYMPGDPRLTHFASEADRRANIPTGRVDMRDPAPAEVAPGGPMNVVDMARPYIPPKFERDVAQATDTGATIPVMVSQRPEGTRGHVGGIPVVVGPSAGMSGNVYREAIPNVPGLPAMRSVPATPSPGQMPPTNVAVPPVLPHQALSEILAGVQAGHTTPGQAQLLAQEHLDTPERRIQFDRDLAAVARAMPPEHSVRNQIERLREERNRRR